MTYWSTYQSVCLSSPSSLSCSESGDEPHKRTASIMACDGITDAALFLLPNVQIGTVRVELRELASQETESFHRPLTTMDKASGKSVSVPGALYFTARFQYSKVVPLRKKVYLLADQKRAVEKEIALLTVGRLKR